ncbi:MAG: hypothetical protein EBX17_12770 [Betaproteobacteria bacterium]|nr:hypothetical protein [Betaproteobacteria bacterium]
MAWRRVSARSRPSAPRIDPDRQALYDRLCGTRLVISDPKAQTSDLRSDLLADPAHQPGKTGDQSFTQSTK